MPALVSLAFVHEDAAPSAAPVPLRRDATTPVASPEWRAGAAVAPADAPAAFALDSLDETALTVVAVLRDDAPVPRALEIRAQAVARWGSPAPVLGGVAARTVRFARRGSEQREVFAVRGVRLHERGVGVHDVEWAWQARPGPGRPWSRIATTRHRVYGLLRTPVEPWTSAPAGAANVTLPWTALLEYACRWTAGARSPEAVAERVTAAVNGLGASVVSYDCPGFGGTHYTFPTPSFHLFDCSQFVRLLQGSPYASRYLNCMDCAAMVSTTANLLGCELWQSAMFDDELEVFDCNPVLAIGSRTWQTPCRWPGFAYHEAAWTGDADEDDGIYDACLQVDGAGTPGLPPLVPLLPAGLRFGAAGAGGYRDRLAAPAGRPHCEPQPATSRRRRAVV